MTRIRTVIWAAVLTICAGRVVVAGSYLDRAERLNSTGIDVAPLTADEKKATWTLKGQGAVDVEGSDGVGGAVQLKLGQINAMQINTNIDLTLGVSIKTGFTESDVEAEVSVFGDHVFSNAKLWGGNLVVGWSVGGADSDSDDATAISGLSLGLIFPIGTGDLDIRMVGSLASDDIYDNNGTKENTDLGVEVGIGVYL